MKKLLLIMSLLVLTGCNGNIENTKIDISSAQCGMCAITIEDALTKADGVKKALVNMDDLKVTVLYDPDKTELKNLELAISDVGYQANEMSANLDAYKRLPNCCKLPEDR